MSHIGGKVKHTTMKAFLTVGLPGCGKSTFAKKYKGKLIEINLDQCREFVNGSEEDQGNIMEVLKYRDSLIEQAAIHGADIIISDTNLHPEFRKQLIDRLKELGFVVTIVHFKTSLETCKQRNVGRSRQVPDEIMDQMEDMRNQHPVSKEEADFYLEVV